MANYYNREDDWVSDLDRFSRPNRNRNLGTGYDGSTRRDSEWSRSYSDDYDGEPQRYAGGSGASYYGGRGYDRGQSGRSSNRDRASGYYLAGSQSPRRYYEGTERSPYYGRDFDYEVRYRNDRNAAMSDRDWFDRASDEVASWFGDEEAEHRRRYDERRDARYRGRGPRAYRRSDERIREDINDRLTDDAYLDAYDIEVTVNEGEVTLSGTVTDRRDKRIAEDVAESVSGVTNVQNNLRVSRAGEIRISAGSESTPGRPDNARAAKQR